MRKAQRAMCVAVALATLCVSLFAGVHAGEEPHEEAAPVVYSEPLSFGHITFLPSGAQGALPIVMAGADMGITSEKPRYMPLDQAGTCAADFGGDTVVWSGQNVTIDQATGAWTADHEGRASVTAAVASDSSRQDTWSFEVIALKVTSVDLSVLRLSPPALPGRSAWVYTTVSHSLSGCDAADLPADRGLIGRFERENMGVRYATSANIAVDPQTRELTIHGSGPATIRATSEADSSIFSEASFPVYDIARIAITNAYGAQPGQMAVSAYDVPFLVKGYLSDGREIQLNSTESLDSSGGIDTFTISSDQIANPSLWSFALPQARPGVSLTVALASNPSVTDTWTFDVVDTVADETLGLSGTIYSYANPVKVGQTGNLVCTPDSSAQEIVWRSTENIGITSTGNRTCAWTANARGIASITAALAADPGQSVTWTFEVTGGCCACEGCAACLRDPALHNTEECTCAHNFPFYCVLCGGPCEKFLRADAQGRYHTLVGNTATRYGRSGMLDVVERVLVESALACWCGSPCPACRADAGECGGRNCVCGHDFPDYCSLCEGACQHVSSLDGEECHYIGLDGRVTRFYANPQYLAQNPLPVDSARCDACRLYRWYNPDIRREVSPYAGGPACKCRDRFPAYCPYCEGACQKPGNEPFEEYHWLNLFDTAAQSTVRTVDEEGTVLDSGMVAFPFGAIVFRSMSNIHPTETDIIYYGSASGNADMTQMSDAKRRFLALQPDPDPDPDPDPNPDPNPNPDPGTGGGTGTNPSTGSGTTPSAGGTSSATSSGGTTATRKVAPKRVSTHTLVDGNGVPLAGPAQAWQTLHFPAAEGARLLTLWTSDGLIFGPDGEAALRQIEALQGAHLTVFIPREGDDPAEALGRLMASGIIPTVLVSTAENLLRYTELLEPLEEWIAGQNAPNLRALLALHAADHAGEGEETPFQLVPLRGEADAPDAPPAVSETPKTAPLCASVYAGAPDGEKAEAVRLLEFLLGEEGTRLLAPEHAGGLQ